VLDVHCHLLPGIDDGPADAGESVLLARQMAAQGVRVVAATPHCRGDHPAVVPAELAGRCAAIQERLEAEGVGIEVVPAGEVDLLWAFDSSEEDLRLASYGQRGTDLLLETPYVPLTTNFEALLFELTVKGYRLLLAHPERNPTFQQRPERVVEMVNRGALLQVTATSLARRATKSRSGKMAQDLVRRGLAHVIASDAHAPSAPERSSLADGVRVAAELVGERRARWMVEDAPQAIIAGAPLPQAPPIEPPRKRGVLRRLAG
jgi:protein-tyrosine phosphatase